MKVNWNMAVWFVPGHWTAPCPPFKEGMGVSRITQ